MMLSLEKVTSTKLPLWGFAVVTVLLIIGAVLALSPELESAYTPDSISYMLASAQVRDGHGLVISNYSLFNPGFKALTIWPPLYPLLLATGINPLILQALLLGGAGVLVYIVLVRVAEFRPWVAFPSSLVALLSWPLLVDASYVWSEPFAVFWMVLSLFGFSTAFENNKYSWARWVLGVSALAAAVYTRYAMLVFVPGVIFAMLWLPLAWRARLKLATATSMGFVILIAPLLTWNVIQSGYLSGGVRGSSSDSIVDVLHAAGSTIMSVFARYSSAQEIIMAVAVVGVIVVGAYVLQNMRRGEAGDLPAESVWLAILSGSMAAAYILGIMALRTWKSFDAIDTRLISPAVPFLMVSLAAFAKVVWQSVLKNPLWERVVWVLPFMVLFLLSAGASIQSGAKAARDWRDIGTPRWNMSKNLIYSNLQPVRFPKFEGVLLDIRPAVYSFRTGWDFRYPPKEPWTHEQLLRVAEAARGVLIDSAQSQRLAKAMEKIVSNPRWIKIGGAPIFLWGPVQAFEPTTHGNGSR